MGRGKIEIKRIENSSNRQVTYSKRRNGIIKKAKEITVLCDAQVSLVVIGSSGKMHDYCSPNTSVIEILDNYQRKSGKYLWDPKHQNLSNEIDRVKKENDSMQIELRHLKGEDITSLHHKELMVIEDTLEHGVACVRDRQMELYDAVEHEGRVLMQENNRLREVLRDQEMEMEGRQMQENGYHHQMPFAFRVQPIQPNLQERM